MKRNLLWVSFSCFLVVSTLAYQNCNAKKFNATVESNIAGSLGTMGADGTITGEVTVKSCQDEGANCPSSAVIRFYAIVDGKKVRLSPDAQAVAVPNQPGKYTFTYKVPEAYKCKVIQAYIVDPTTSSEVQIPLGDGFVLWGDKSTCGNIDPVDPVDPIDPGSGPKVEFTDIKFEGRLVQISGNCSPNNAAINFSGDLLDLVNLTGTCTNSQFAYCGLMENHYANNILNGQINSNGQVGKDSATVELDCPPTVILTIDSMAKNDSTHNLTVSGKCTPQGILKLNLYNSDIATINCSSGGTWNYSGNVLVNTSPRILYIRQTTPFGVTTNIEGDIDSNGQAINCAITSTVANVGICSSQAGNVKGTCKKGLPVFVYVNDKLQEVGYCSASGSFDISHILINKGTSNTIKIKQSSPYGMTCESSKTLSSF